MGEVEGGTLINALFQLTRNRRRPGRLGKLNKSKSGTRLLKWRGGRSEGRENKAKLIQLKIQPETKLSSLRRKKVEQNTFVDTLWNQSLLQQILSLRGKILKRGKRI